MDSSSDSRASAPSEAMQKALRQIEALRAEVGKVVVGQGNMVTKLIVGILTGGHILVEGVPGLAKTTVIKAIADAIGGRFNRIQFTPDLLPSDIVGTEMYSAKDDSFKIKKGPILAHLVLADEINRAPAKVQSALLECMEERQFTIAESTFALPKPFLVMATQNPVEQDGTYPLPEAQLDRFMLKLNIDYPSIEDEIQIMARHDQAGHGKTSAVLTIEDIPPLQDIVRGIYVDEKIYSYVARLVAATRHPSQYRLGELAAMIMFGASPRASLNLVKGGKALALLAGRDYVLPDDIRGIAKEVLRHRILLSYEAEAENVTSDAIVDAVLGKVPLP